MIVVRPRMAGNNSRSMKFLRICFPLLAYGNQQQCPAVPCVILLGKEKVLTSACFLAYSLCLSRVFPGLGGLPQSVSWPRFALKTLPLEAVPQMVLLLARRSQVEGVLNSVGASKLSAFIFLAVSFLTLVILSPPSFWRTKSLP